MLLRDENVNVVKRAILTMTQLYKVALQVSAPPPRPPAPPQLTGGLLCQRAKPGSDRIPCEPDAVLISGSRQHRGPVVRGHC